MAKEDPRGSYNWPSYYLVSRLSRLLFSCDQFDKTDSAWLHFDMCTSVPSWHLWRAVMSAARQEQPLFCGRCGRPRCHTATTCQGGTEPLGWNRMMERQKGERRWRKGVKMRDAWHHASLPVTTRPTLKPKSFIKPTEKTLKCNQLPLTSWVGLLNLFAKLSSWNIYWKMKLSPLQSTGRKANRRKARKMSSNHICGL